MAIQDYGMNRNSMYDNNGYMDEDIGTSVLDYNQGINTGSMNYGPQSNNVDGGVDWNKLMLGGKNQSGALNMGFKALGGALQYGLAKKQFDQNKKQFSFQKGLATENYGNRARDHNRMIEDRYRNRAADANYSGPSVQEAIAQYGVDPNALR